MSKEQLAEEQKKADERMRQHWAVEDGVIVFDGKGKSLVAAKDYGDFEFYVDWKIKEKGDSGIYPARHAASTDLGLQAPQHRLGRIVQ